MPLLTANLIPGIKTLLVRYSVRPLFTFALSSIIFGLSTTVFADTAAPANAGPSVEVTQVLPVDIRRWSQFSGRLTPVESVAIKPRVGGAIQAVLFNEGEIVKRGQPLFVIDPRPHDAALKRAKAQLVTARAQAKLTADELERSRQLVASKLVSQSVYDEAATANQVAQAAILQAESSFSEAELIVEYAHIAAPISGRIGRAELTVGNMVEAGGVAPVLTSIVSNDQMYAEFRVSEQAYLALMRDSKANTKMPVELTLSDNNETVYRGFLHAFDNHLDAASGTIRARAIFENSDGLLTAGMFANIQLGSATTEAELLVPERAIGTNQDKKYVYVIDQNNTVQYREVTLGQQYRGYRIIQAGLNGGEKVAVNGFSHIRPNIQVTPVDVATAEHLAAQ